MKAVDSKMKYAPPEMFKNLFRIADMNGDGKLSFDEVMQGAKRLGGGGASGGGMSDADKMRIFDMNGDGQISENEFVATSAQFSAGMPEAQLRAGFRMFDKNGNKVLDIDEWRAMQGAANGGPGMGAPPGGAAGGDAGPPKCSMTQRQRFDGSCGMCKRPYVQA